ncbi:MAG: class I SAM-dependent methyltransferase [Betaproteobacteria bacterium]
MNDAGYWRDKYEQCQRTLERHDLLPLPPAHLRVRIGGWDDPDHFLGVGRKIYWDLKRVLGGIGRTRESFESILDFGCGCARTLRFFPRRDGLHGCDIDPEAIAWCREHLGERASFQVNSPEPPLPYADGAFDFVYAISVFTHLPEDMQLRWWEELARVVRPGGIVLASAHGEQLLDGTEEQARQLREHGFLYAVGGGTDGLPSFYQTSFHTPDYVKANWTKHFELVHSLPRGINNHQDAYLLQAKPA